MKESKLAPTRAFLGLLAVCVAQGAAVEIVGELRSANGESIEGTVTVVENGPGLAVNHHHVDTTGAFRIAADGSAGLVVLARSLGHASEERHLPVGVAGTVGLRFGLPVGQAVEGRVVDASGNGIPGVSLRVRYHDPDKPDQLVRVIAFASDEEVTDGDGRFGFPNVGTDVPFVIDVHSPDYVAKVSQQFKIAPGWDRPLEDIVLRESGATVVARLLSKDGEPVAGVPVTLLADPAGRSAKSRGSWLHDKSFRQKGVSSSRGSVRFSGVPPGRVIVRAKVPSGVIENRTSVVSGVETRLELRVL